MGKGCRAKIGLAAKGWRVRMSCVCLAWIGEVEGSMGDALWGNPICSPFSRVERLDARWGAEWYSRDLKLKMGI